MRLIALGNPMKTAFISDLHLSANHPENTSLFLHFMEDCINNNLDALYILGDFFDYWIGDDLIRPHEKEIIHALHQATRKGLPIYFMHGNRDFLISKNFLRASGCQLIPEEHVISLYGIPTLLMHGDTLCTQDVTYLKFRRFAHHPVIKKCFLCLPRFIRERITKNLRQKSNLYTAKTDAKLMDVTSTAVVAVLQKYQSFHLIHGHTHLPATHTFILNNQHATRTVLPAWHTQGGALICHADGSQQTKFFSLPHYLSPFK